MRWNAKIEALRNVELEVLDIVKRKTSKSCGMPAKISVRPVRPVTSLIGNRVTGHC
jgi:hypothetical protein